MHTRLKEHIITTNGKVHNCNETIIIIQLQAENNTGTHETAAFSWYKINFWYETKQDLLVLSRRTCVVQVCLNAYFIFWPNIWQESHVFEPTSVC